MKTILRKTPLLVATMAVSVSLLPVSYTAAQDAGGNATPVEAESLDLTPKRYKLDRYTRIWAERSPFEIIVEDTGEQEPEDPPFEDYALAGYSKRGNIWRATVVNLKDPKEKHYLESGKVSPDGFELLNFKVDRNYRKSEVVVRRSGKSGAIGFSEKRMKPATFAKGVPAASKSGAKSKAKTPGRPNATNTAAKTARPGQPNAAANKTAGGKSDAAAQIRQMLQNRASSNKTSTSSQGGSKRQPRRRVILPPSR